MYKLSGSAARAALVTGLVSALGTGYAAHATDRPGAAPPPASAPHTAPHTAPHAPGGAPVRPGAAPPTLADTGADANATLLGALSVGAVVTGAAAVALSRRSSRGRYGEE
ncbi:hypothetical protein DWB77_04342 [Streptomyces hundungensis]|uniref:Gram-positive cocci surface proteins LPxTG domain-containing protein n=1 Tax=Streptomyces hundungensis TaxID=1077946 RepID=A0A387HMV6_9ACTN|nr:hypothetical protein [Streptomyces hundungensis]AYG82172.1 hypothetical protein DWB77_04342 [Streptomyces hundungensis]